MESLGSVMVTGASNCKDACQGLKRSLPELEQHNWGFTGDIGRSSGGKERLNFLPTYSCKRRENVE
jgi:hypothetical protein